MKVCRFTLTDALVPVGHGNPMTVLCDRLRVLVAADLESEPLEARIAEELKK